MVLGVERGGRYGKDDEILEVFRRTLSHVQVHDNSSSVIMSISVTRLEKVGSFYFEWFSINFVRILCIYRLLLNERIIPSKYAHGRYRFFPLTRAQSSL